MRSIKFRAWDKKSKKMRIIDSIAFHGLGHFDIPTLDIKLINLWGYDIIEDKCFIIRRDPEQVKLLQYTGLKDKNGKEIYEGDVISVINDTFQAEVIYEAPSFKLKWRDDFHVKRNAENKTIAWNAHIIYEVVGNIYEHPHLFEESK